MLSIIEPKIKKIIKNNLIFWRKNEYQFLIIFLIVRDLLTCLISTIASKSAFGAVDRIFF